MTSLTIELKEDTCRQLRERAEARGISLDLLIEELGYAALATESRFRTMASGSNPAHAILDRLDHRDRLA